jgi:hypothetical protein
LAEVDENSRAEKRNSGPSSHVTVSSVRIESERPVSQPARNELFEGRRGGGGGGDCCNGGGGGGGGEGVVSAVVKLPTHPWIVNPDVDRPVMGIDVSLVASAAVKQRRLELTKSGHVAVVQ